MKKEILNFFINSQSSLNEISKKFECTEATIIRNLKKELGNEKYKEIIDSRKSKKKLKTLKNQTKSDIGQNNDETLNMEYSDLNFVELAPLDYQIDNFSRKELSSIPITEIIFPNVVYMIVHKNIELEVKFLKDYPDWEFLPTEDLKRKTIEVYFDSKKAKRVCTKEQKVIKVPNTNVFKIVAPILISRGISRIVSDDKLIAL
mgnify:CR=1 FL=1|tara:strand:+ start:2090 stop:2698 length:609 start_codon:yes stop_codon:yes gene_type:complete